MVYDGMHCLKVWGQYGETMPNVTPVYQGHSIEAMGLQPGDVVATGADTQALHEWVGFQPSTPIEVGIQHFAKWYRDFYKKRGKIDSFNQVKKYIEIFNKKSKIKI